jgi:hypothetical protein
VTDHQLARGQSARYDEVTLATTGGATLVKMLLILLLALSCTEAQAQFRFLDINPKVGKATSPTATPAAHSAFLYASGYMRTEVACRHVLSGEHRAALRNAAGRIYIAAGYFPEGAEAVVRELDKSFGNQKQWTVQRCDSAYARFLKNREHELSAVANLAR